MRTLSFEIMQTLAGFGAEKKCIKYSTTLEMEEKIVILPHFQAQKKPFFAAKQKIYIWKEKILLVT